MALITNVWAPSTEGADVDPRGARVSNYVASGSQNGIKPSPLGTGAVLPTATPSSDVRVSPFVGAIVNTYPGAFGEAYHVVNPADFLVPIRATGSGAGRSDVVVWRIDDPGGTIADIETHVFAYAEVIENVAPSIRTAPQLRAAKGIDYPFVWLARVTLPASTATVTSGMIDTSGRVQLAGLTETDTIVRAGDLAPTWLNNSTTDGQAFPGGGGIHSVYIPEWATRMRVTFEWLDLEYTGTANSYGDRWVDYGGVRTETFHFDAPNTGLRTTANWKIVDDVEVPVNMRGTEVVFAARGKLGSGAGTGQVRVIENSSTVLTVEFRETL